jgi:hypothetical protein
MTRQGPHIPQGEYCGLVAGQGWKGKITYVSAMDPVEVDHVGLPKALVVADSPGTDPADVVQAQAGGESSKEPLRARFPGADYYLGGSRGASFLQNPGVNTCLAMISMEAVYGTAPASGNLR